MTVFRMVGTREPPGTAYLTGRGVVRRKYERIIERLAPVAGVKKVVIAAGATVDTIYAADGGRWLQAIDMIDELARMAAERHPD